MARVLLDQPEGPPRLEVGLGPSGASGEVEEMVTGTRAGERSIGRVEETLPGDGGAPAEPSTGRATEQVARAGRALGRVVDREGRPVAGADIWVRERMAKTALPWPWARTERLGGRSDEAGEFAVDAGPGMELEARKEGHAASRLVRLAPGLAACLLELRGPAARLAIEVQSSGEPLPGAQVDLRRPRSEVSSGEHGSRRLIADSNGRLELLDLAPGEVNLIASGEGFAPMAQALVLRAGEESAALLHLDPGARVGGKVLDSEGRTLGGIELSLPDREPPAHSITAADGTFQWNSLAPGTARLVARGSGYVPYEQELVLSPGGNSELLIRLVSLSSLSGRVLDERGRGLAGVKVSATASDQPQGVEPGHSDEQGRFRLSVLAGVEYTLALREEGQWLSVERPSEWTFVAPAEDLVLRLDGSDRASAWVVGCVVEGTLPLEGARFQLSDGKHLGTVGVNTPGTQRSQADGRFRIGPLPCRSYVLTVHPEQAEYPSFRSEPFTVLPDEELDLGDLPVPPRAGLQVTARFEGGEAPGEAFLALTEAGGESLIHRLDAEGGLDVGLLPGSYEAVVYGSGMLSVQREFTVAAGQEEAMALILKQAHRRPIDFRLPTGEASGVVQLFHAKGELEFETELEASDPTTVLWPALTGGAYSARLHCGERTYGAELQISLPTTSEVALQLNWTPKD